MSITNSSFRISVLLCALFWQLNGQAADVNRPDLESANRGEYLATAGDCTACHTAPGGKPFAGGLAIHSPVGTIVASNITPSIDFGIGSYSEAEFVRAIRQGIRRDGANLYPAMPYTSYALLTDDDIRDLYTFFQQRVPAVDVAAPKTTLPFPFGIRLSMKAWNVLFSKNEPYRFNSKQSAEWNRGKYLVDGLAHCGECHTPRGFLMQSKNGQELAGGEVDDWRAPNVTPDDVSGIGTWTNQDVVQYLHTGSVRHKAQAAASMGQAVEDSFQYLTEQDLLSIAIYLRSIPKIQGPENTSARFNLGAAFSSLASIRGTKPIAAHSDMDDGAVLFQGNCTSCHSSLGQGSKDGYYPSLFDNSVTGANDANNLIAVIIDGVNRTTASGQAYMPGFGGAPNDLGALTDKQIVALGNYIELHYGSPNVVLTVDQVETVRHGGPASHILALARIAMGVVVIFLILICIIILRRRRWHHNATN